jgi:hypothetical protein
MGGHQGVMLTDEWLTPPDLLRALGPFDLDPCAPIVRPWPTAATHYTIADDGLSRKWVGRVWLNPPYGPHTGTWLERLHEHGNGIALIFARTETEAWFRHIWGVASGILFLRGRLNFHFVSGKRADKNSGAPSALIAYGENNAGILETCGIAGSLVRRAAGAGRGAEMRVNGTREKTLNAALIEQRTTTTLGLRL